MSALSAYRDALASAPMGRRVGWVRGLRGLAVEADGPDVRFGEMCRISYRSADDGTGCMAEVVGLAPHRVLLLPYGNLAGVAPGSLVTALGHCGMVQVGAELIGRVVDGLGEPLDGGPPLRNLPRRPVAGVAPNPMERPRIGHVFETGVRALDGLLTLGRGQRVGIFAGSGVGKSSLLGMVTRHARADVNVIALIGERGREVREFVEDQLGADGLARSVVVVATSEQPALARIRAAHAAVAVAAHFAEQGRHVLLTMDSITRLAMARREVGLSVGEPATARGYTPSVFAELPQLCERCGAFPSGGSVTALLTVLVEGDDLNEPLADSMRAILDGHIVLSRELAQQGHFPAIDVPRSVSRLMADLATPQERRDAAEATRHLALLERSRQLIELGAYVRGSHPDLDRALSIEAGLYAWLRQDTGGTPRSEAVRALAQILHAKEPS